jgi:LPS-assembly lipoprotein
MRKFSVLLYLSLSLLLSACGFKLRGDYQIPEQFKQLHVASRQSHAPMQRTLKARLSSFDIALIDDPIEAQQSNTSVIVLQPERLERQLLSLFATGQVAEYELIYTLNYQVITPNEEPFDFTVDIIREYIDDPDAVLAKSRELDLIVSEMREQAADNVIRQLATLESVVQ